MSTLIFIGHKGCGKSFVGKQVAKALSKPFLDLDVWVVNTYALRYRQTLTCGEIVKKKGVDFFRALEKEGVKHIAKGQYAVIATGGGTVLDPANVERLQTLGVFIYLEAELSILKTRLKTLPYYIDPAAKITSLEKVYFERLSLYSRLAQATIKIQEKNLKCILEQLWALKL